MSQATGREKQPRARAPRRWPVFLFGLVAPFVLPFLIYFVLGSRTQPWMHGVAWLAVLALGLVAGMKDRRWAFLVGAVTGITAFLAWGLAREAGWLEVG